MTDEERVALRMKEYERLSATELHRERARLLRIVLLQRYMEMRVISEKAGDTVAGFMAKADSSMYERVLKLDAAMEELAARKESE